MPSRLLYSLNKYSESLTEFLFNDVKYMYDVGEYMFTVVKYIFTVGKQRLHAAEGESLCGMPGSHAACGVECPRHASAGMCRPLPVYIIKVSAAGRHVAVAADCGWLFICGPKKYVQTFANRYFC